MHATTSFDNASSLNSPEQYAVMNINGTIQPRCRNTEYISIPLICGMTRSEITHCVAFNPSDDKNSDADSKVCATMPIERTRLASDSRTDSSSSIIETIGCLKDRPCLAKLAPICSAGYDISYLNLKLYIRKQSSDSIRTYKITTV
jgi:hypothetical protein